MYELARLGKEIKAGKVKREKKNSIIQATFFPSNLKQKETKVQSFDIELLPCAKMPVKANPSDAAYDLFANITEPIILLPGERVLIPSGVKLQLKEGWRARICSRSGLAVKNSIDIGAGLIDASYTKEIGIVVCNNARQIDVDTIYETDTQMNEKIAVPAWLGEFTITPGMKIAQMCIERVEETELIQVNKIDQTDRGGIGSTGLT